MDISAIRCTDINIFKLPFIHWSHWLLNSKFSNISISFSWYLTMSSRSRFYDTDHVISFLMLQNPQHLSLQKQHLVTWGNPQETIFTWNICFDLFWAPQIPLQFHCISLVSVISPEDISKPEWIINKTVSVARCHQLFWRQVRKYVFF